MPIILFVSDSDSVIERSRDLLTHMGFDVYTTGTPEDAGSFCELRRPDAVITDIEMQDGDGFKAISQIRSKSKDCLVVATTRGGHEDLWPMVGFACGADSYIVGPLTSHKIQDALEPKQERYVRR